MYPAFEIALEPGHDVRVTACMGRSRVQVAGPSWPMPHQQTPRWHRRPASSRRAPELSQRSTPLPLAAGFITDMIVTAGWRMRRTKPEPGSAGATLQMPRPSAR